ncbi:MAG TPA: transporter substrate-binding domain-containing protein [Segeticoccus sp.]|uniref:transporter substrate-binding domain-containing protein n=1 Tax=Segeticoccus sp. TaxID=2706531 RepID=UPI002D7E961F|nr:transporter substrate-binding domain-containing protein [Segeticoccus sp.]HET8600177.1 transporter substrate-binding domain-containing protein [Segeticoccus sp.]
MPIRRQHDHQQGTRTGGRRWRAAAIGAAGALALSACGGGGAQSASGGSLIKKDTLTVAMSGQFRPFSFHENGKLTGFDYDIGQAIAQQMGLTYAPKTAEFDSLIQGVQSNRYDVIIGSMTPTPKREKAVDFTNGYYSSGAQMFVRKGSDCTDPAQMQNPTIGVARGTTYQDYLSDQKWVGGTKTYASDVTALVDLSKGRMDGVVTDQLVGLYQIKKTGRDLKTCGNPLYTESPAFALKKGNDGLKKDLNSALAAIKKDGTYKKLSVKWFGQDISS